MEDKNLKVLVMQARSLLERFDGLLLEMREEGADCFVYAGDILILAQGKSFKTKPLKLEVRRETTY